MDKVKAEIKCRFILEYVDDFKRKHITIVNSISEVKFYEERFFGNVIYTPIKENSFSFKETFIWYFKKFLL